MRIRRIGLVVLLAVSAAAAELASPEPVAASRPEAAREPDPMAAAASALLASLDARQRTACTHEFGDAERRNWRATPMGEAGVRLDEMTETQRARVRDLLESALSENGLATVDGVLLLERILVGLMAERGGSSRLLAPGRYFVTIYGDPGSGDPGTDAPWGWRIEGHHLSITFTCRSRAWTAHGPIFIGAQPARVRGGEHDGLRVLGAKDDGVRAFLLELDEAQRAKATGGGELPGNIVLLPGRDEGFAEPAGLAGAELTAYQKGALYRILADWADMLRVDLAEAEARRMLAGLDETRFLWMGSTGADEPHYWRIVGPHFALEYAAPERDPDHVHAVWRDTERDFGGDLLRRHLEQEHPDGR